MGSQMLDVLVCPDCRGRMTRSTTALRCPACGLDHPIENGIPYLLPRPMRGIQIEHELELEVRSDYPPCLQRLLSRLGRDQVVLDLGAGERETDDPRVIRLDLRSTPRVDVVADAHRLPLQSDSVALVLAGAVFEHLKDPFAAAAEIHRVLKPGGMVIADCSFVFPFHGFPASYFHASGEGLRRVFGAFREVAVEVAPWLMPSYGLEVILSEWGRLCRPRTDHDREFLAAVRGLARFRVRELDACFDQRDALRLAAGTAFLGVKHIEGDETVLPAAAMRRWRDSKELQQRYPRPWELLPTLCEDDPDSYLRWLWTEGRDAEVDRWYSELPAAHMQFD